MGLDMYLERYPRYKNYGPKEIRVFEEWKEWQNRGEKYKDSTFRDWCGMEETDLPRKEDIPFFESMLGTKYWAWDEDHKYPHERVYEQVMYWRKANAIHKWFVDHVQDGEDDCEYHREVTKQDLEELRDACKEILEKCVLVKGKVQNGWNWDDKKKKEIPNYQDGLLVANPDVCERILPSCDGFFFGGTEYNEWYIQDVKYTFETLSKLIEENDFEKQQLWYCSSW